MGLWDVVANTATAGGYSLFKEGYEYLSEKDKEAGTGANAGGADGATGGAEPAAGAAGSVVAGKELKYCCYVIEGDYLLNSETGEVWLIDKEKKELFPIKRRKFAIEGISTGILLEAKKQYLLDRKDLEIGKLPHAIRKEFAGHIDKLTKALDKEIKENMGS
jgi:hypothetical protein